MPEVASQTLDFVGRELNVTLAEARTALENYVEQPDNINLLERCTQELHQVQGVLRVLEIYGAALLAEEMEQVASYLLQTASERKSQAESLDALMRAMVQLPSYLERVLAGGRDLALVLLPLLNDLRAVRGSALLSEGTLLLLNLKSDKQAQPVAAAPGEPPLTVEQWGRRLRARFQVGLIGWIRGERVEQNLDILAAVAQKLEQIATRQPVFQLWWVTGAVIEALQENGLEGGVSVKRLLGLGDREIRRLYEQGEARYAQTPAVELLNNLLYYVGRAESNGPRVQAVRASFRLQELLPVDESIEQERENLSAPSVKLMQTVAVAIREDLSKVKDVLDIFVRRGAGQPKELAPQVEMLRKIGDTLGVLGLGELRGNVQVETERLEKIVDGTLPADESTLVQIAATLIGVEDKLDSQLVGLIRPKQATDLEEDEDNDFQQVQAAVLRECILNLARIKESISQNVGGTLDAAGLDAWQELMRGLKAGLLMLGKARAVEVIEGITGQLKRVMQPGGQGLPPGFMDRLADAIVSVEYYMETLQAGRSDPWYMLDNAQACVQALEQQATPVVPTLPPVEPSAYAKTLQISPKVVFGAESDPASTLVGAQTQAHTRTSVPLTETADPELVKLFIEEAHEELAKIKKFFPAWDLNPMEREALVTVRRSFHTLKGSGRMVGARELGEFAWSIENLLNRVLDNTLTRSPAIVDVLRDSVNALPEMIEQLETGRAPRIDPAAIAARANALASGKPASAAGAAPASGTLTAAIPSLSGATEKTQVIPPPAAASAGGGSSAGHDARHGAATAGHGPGAAGHAPATAGHGAADSLTATVSATNVVPMPVAPKSGAAAPTPPVAPVAPGVTPPKGPTFAQSVTASDFAHTQTIVSAQPPQSLQGRDAQPSIAEPFSADAKYSADFSSEGDLDLEFPGPTEAQPETESAPTGDSLTADLNNLDLLLPEEPSAEAPSAEASFVLGENFLSGDGEGEGIVGSAGHAASAAPAAGADADHGASDHDASASADRAAHGVGAHGASDHDASAAADPAAHGAGAHGAADYGGADAAHAAPTHGDAAHGAAARGDALHGTAGAAAAAAASNVSAADHGAAAAAGRAAHEAATHGDGTLGSTGAATHGAPGDAHAPVAHSAVDHRVADHGAQVEDPVAAQSGPDDVLRDIYSRETANHVATVRAYLDREEGMPEAHAIPEEVYRACHTLSGSSKMAQARHGIRLAEPLDHWLRRVFNSGLGLLNQDLHLLSDCMMAMEAVVTHLDEVTGYFQNHQVLMDRIAQAEKVLDQRIAQASEEQADTSVSGEEDELSEDAGDFDPEVASIFCEEAMELIEVCESALAEWRLEPSSADYRSALKRPLHTLKGGARMAGITAMGDLSHELETLVMQVDNGSVPITDAVFDVIQASLDELARMREAVANGRRVSSARQMIARIHALSKPGSAAAAPPAAAAPTAKPVAPKGELFRRASNQPTAAPPAPQSFAPPPPALTPAEQETAAADDESEVADDGPAGVELRFDDPEAAADFEAARAEIAAADSEAAAAEADLHGTDLPPDAETQLNRALPPQPSLPDTLVAQMPDFEPVQTAEPAPEFDTAATSEPTSGDLAAELLASYPTTEQSGEVQVAGETDSGSYDLSGSELADLTNDLSASFADRGAGDGHGEREASGDHAADAEHAADGQDAPDGQHAADRHVATDYMTARDSAANEEVSPVQSWTPESTQETPNLGDIDSGRSGFSAFAQETPLSEDQPASSEPAVASFESSDGSTHDAAESLLGNWANPGGGEPAPIWPAEAEPAPHEGHATDEASASERESGTAHDGAFTPEHSEFDAAAASAEAEHGAPEAYASLEAYAPEAHGLPHTQQAAAASQAADSPSAYDRSAHDQSASERSTHEQSTPEQSASAHAHQQPAHDRPASEQSAYDQPDTQQSSAPTPAGATTAAKSVSANLTRGDSKSEDGLVAPQAVPPGRDPVAPAERQEMARVDAELLDQLLNISGEASIARSRLEQQLGSIDFNLGELSRTVTRLKEQLRNLEIETEAQILHRHEDESSHRGDFDPLELDRYSSIQQFSRALAETANDVGSIQQLLENLGKETQNLLQQQARTITELQNGLMRTRMVPFQRHVQRLSRIVRQAAADTGKKAELVVEGASGELDRQVLERMLPPFEHMLRNAVVHGIEKPLARAAAGKPEAGKIVLELHREGAEVMVRLIDDGAGMNLKAIRDKGAALGLITPGQTISDEDAMQLILEPGFSTAGTITQQAGRGVGMDVVATEIKRLGGALHMETKLGQGTVFTIRLPFTLAISHALVVRTGDEFYALPLPTVEGVLRLSKAEVLAHLGKDASAFDYGGQKYRFQHLAAFVQLEASPLPEQDVTIPVVLVRAGEHSTGLVADELVGSREIVVKSVGPQISSIRGISGATILGDGRIVIILDIGALVRAEWRGRSQTAPVALKDKSDKRTFAMVVDDSITVRRVTQRLLERNGMRVLTARDGMDAVTLLQDNVPDIILLDIEMPRMDGYEVAAHVRNDPRLKDVPIIMITSRVGEKHRARAIELGVDDYLGKPYQEAQLLDAIAPLVERNRAQSGSYERLSGDARV
ncbi:MAG: Hpt domain-containing protein [Proteobacteria bacterium]|nr:Hpt domain-containing protein [Pseudomonadota bacterium]